MNNQLFKPNIMRKILSLLTLVMITTVVLATQPYRFITTCGTEHVQYLGSGISEEELFEIMNGYNVEDCGEEIIDIEVNYP